MREPAVIEKLEGVSVSNRCSVRQGISALHRQRRGAQCGAARLHQLPGAISSRNGVPRMLSRRALLGAGLLAPTLAYAQGTEGFPIAQYHDHRAVCAGRLIRWNRAPYRRKARRSGRQAGRWRTGPAAAARRASLHWRARRLTDTPGRRCAGRACHQSAYRRAQRQLQAASGTDADRQADRHPARAGDESAVWIQDAAGNDRAIQGETRRDHAWIDRNEFGAASIGRAARRSRPAPT